MENNKEGNQENKQTGLTAIIDSIETAVTGIPAPLRKNFFRALGQLCTAAVDVPVSWLEGMSAEIRATTNARIEIIKKGGTSISEQIDVPKVYVEKASTKYAAKIVREQVNLDHVALNAALELSQKTDDGSFKDSKDISEDWLNEFENYARLKSSDDMRAAFGKILSGEIAKPGSFSIKTIRIISQLDNQAAKLFLSLCSHAVSMRVGDKVLDARVISIGGNAASNSLASIGLSFDALNVLHEYGLIISDYNSYMPYSPCIVDDSMKIGAVLKHQNKLYGLVPSEMENYDRELKLHGVALTKAGKELMDVIPLANTDVYTEDLKRHFISKHLNLVEVQAPPLDE